MTMLSKGLRRVSIRALFDFGRTFFYRTNFGLRLARRLDRPRRLSVTRRRGREGVPRIVKRHRLRPNRRYPNSCAREGEQVAESARTREARPFFALSYHVCYQAAMPKRTKRSISLAPELAVAIERAAEERGETFSGWLAATAAHRLRMEAGRRGLLEWERTHGALTPEELDEGRARARALLGRRKAEQKRKSA